MLFSLTSCAVRSDTPPLPAQYPFVTFVLTSVLIQIAKGRVVFFAAPGDLCLPRSPQLPPFCLGKVLIFAQIKEAFAAGRKKKKKRKKLCWFSRRVSLATLSGCTQFKLAACRMIYIVKYDLPLANKRGLEKRGSPARCAVTDVKLSAAFRNFRFGEGCRGNSG